MRYSDTVTILNQKVFRNQLILLVYPVILATGLLLGLVLPTDKLREVFTPTNPFNLIFADHAFEVFTILWLIVFFMRVLNDFTRSKYQSLLPTAHQPKPRIHRAWHILTWSLLKYATTLAIVVLLLKMRDMVHSSQDINISGHYIGIVSLSLTVLLEVGHSISGAEILELDTPDRDLRTLVTYSLLSGTVVVCFMMMLIWWFTLLVTAALYHTLLEKILGLMLGYISPMLIYEGFSRVFVL